MEGEVEADEAYVVTVCSDSVANAGITLGILEPVFSSCHS